MTDTPSHEVIPCICGEIESATLLGSCRIPGHGATPRALVDPLELAAAYQEAAQHVRSAVAELMKARGAWVSRGLGGEERLPLYLDNVARTLTSDAENLLRRAQAAAEVARRRMEADGG